MNVAIIGSGGIAQRHLAALSGEPDIEIVGHVTRTAEHAEAASRQWGGRPYTSCVHLLDHESVEAAWICVPPDAHGPIELGLIERRIPFFVEKPLDANCGTAERVAESLEGTGLIAGVGYHWRALDTIPELHETLARHPARMVLGAWHDATPPPAWWQRQVSSGGQMVEQATHLVDLARFLMGDADVTAAVAEHHGRAAYPDMDVAGASAALLHFHSGAIGVFTATCLLGGLAAASLQFICDGLLITTTQQSVIYDDGHERREIRTTNDPFVDEDRAFLAAIRSNDPSELLCTYADALRTHRLCCASR